MNEPTLHALTQRLDRGKRENRWWKALCSASVAFALIAFSGVNSITLAEEPTGFAEFPWGTSSDLLIEKLAKRCARYDSYAYSGGDDADCADYQLEGLREVFVGLHQNL